MKWKKVDPEYFDVKKDFSLSELELIDLRLVQRKEEDQEKIQLLIPIPEGPDGKLGAKLLNTAVEFAEGKPVDEDEN